MELEFKEDHLTAIIETRGDVRDLKIAMGRIEIGIQKQLENGHACMDDHEDRLNKLEKQKEAEAAVTNWKDLLTSKVIGGIIIASASLSWFLDHLGDILGILRRILFP